MKNTVIAGAALGALAFAASDVVNTEMSVVAETVSRFVNTDAGWLVTAGLLSIAAGSAALTWLVARSGVSRLGTWLLGLWSVGILLAAIFPADPPGQWDNPSVSETVHGLAAWVALLSFVIASVVLGRALPRDPLFTATTVVVVVGLVLFMVTLVDAMATRSLPAVLGVTERIAIGADLLWMALCALRLSPVRQAVRPSAAAQR
ncbi:DUF998 domain-containing protein [Nonomuraea sp. NPDC050310]|uniref:DUF998 domain-containing protein n=1 Tax=Nonomuraea sp. NPDC050310 TaxID=3154935 RepID=UPI0033DA8500